MTSIHVVVDKSGNHEPVVPPHGEVTEPELERFQLATLNSALAQICVEAYDRMIKGFRQEGVPHKIVDQLVRDPLQPGSEVVSQRRDSRRALLSRVYDLQKRNGLAGAGGLMDPLEHADRFAALIVESLTAVLPSDTQEKTLWEARFLIERLVVALSTSQSQNQRQSALVTLSALANVTKPFLPAFSAEVLEARSRVLEIEANTPWGFINHP